MKNLIILITILISTLSFGQVNSLVGTYTSDYPSKVKVRFNEDSTFEYISSQDPVFYMYDDFYEKGRWSLRGDTIILNPNLKSKPFVEIDVNEEQNINDTSFLLMFNHIKRYFDSSQNLIKTDTLQILQLDFWFNEFKKRKVTRVSKHKTFRCAFAGFIPKEVITENRTISIQRPIENIRSVHFGCYELLDTKEFPIKNPNLNRLTFNVYSNYYSDGQIRQMKFLIKNKNVLYTRQNENGEFEKDSFWTGPGKKLKRQIVQAKNNIHKTMY